MDIQFDFKPKLYEWPLARNQIAKFFNLKNQIMAQLN